jgi:hypothetical protein
VKTCAHLEPLERELEARGIKLGPGEKSPYADLGIWFTVDCTFDEPSLRARLNIPQSITYEEYDGRVAGSDATWLCRACLRAIWGIHPRYAKMSTPRVG